jgi:hypothetical protein
MGSFDPAAGVVNWEYGSYDITRERNSSYTLYGLMILISDVSHTRCLAPPHTSIHITGSYKKFLNLKYRSVTTFH